MKKLLLVGAAALAVFSCSPPPFDLTISLSVLAARGLHLEGTVGPVDKMSSDKTPLSAAFFPENSSATGLDLSYGFLLYDEGYGRKLAFASVDAAQGLYHKLSSELALSPSTSGSYPDLVAHALKDATVHRIGGFIYDGKDPNPPTYYEVRADIASGQVSAFYFDQPRNDLAVLFGVSGRVIGVSVLPSTGTNDTAYLLAREDGTGRFLEFTMTMGTAALTFAAAPRGFAAYDLSWLGLPTAMDRAQYFYDPSTEHSFLSWYDSSPAENRWRCWTWWDTTAGSGSELAGVDHRVDALLSTGELFSSDGDSGRVYGSDGVLRASFSLTGLTFVDERYVNGTACMIFSQFLYYQKQPWFRIFSIPTVNLKTLAGG